MKNKNLENVLHECIEKIRRGELTAIESLAYFQEHNETLYRLLETALALESVTLTPPSKQYKQASKNRLFYELMEEFEPERSLPINVPTPRGTVRRPLGLQPIFTIVLVVILSFGVLVGGAQAADAAGPGDFLYPIDLFMEDLRLAFAISDEDRVRLRLEFAEERISEANAQFGLGHFDEGNLALSAYEMQMEEIAILLNQTSVSDIEELQSLAAEENANNTNVLNDLLDNEKFPDQAKDAIEHAIDVSDHTANPNKPDSPPGLEDKDKDQDTADDQDEDKDKDKDKDDQGEDENTKLDKEDKDATKEAEKEGDQD
jgi:hypothetical protein